MSSAPTRIKGLKKNSRSPGSIANAEHHDRTMSHRGIDGIPAILDDVRTDTTTEQAIPDCAILRVFNSEGTVQYVWIGEEGDAPTPVDATNGFAVPPGEVEVFHCPASKDDQKAMMVKTSAAIQVVVIEP